MICKISLHAIITLIIISIISCKSDNTNDNNSSDDININDTLTEKHKKNVKMIFYNVPSPMELAQLLQQTGAEYNSDILNDYRNYEKYTTNSKVALNLGIYGADLSYARMFDQIQSSVNYLSSIRKLSDFLGIPQEEGSFAVSRIEENMENRDSILIIISETYAEADSYLKENGRGGTAALIIIGGWIEALYISTHIIDEYNPNQPLLNLIAEQKYSLNNLIELAKTYPDDEEVLECIPFLKELESKFEKIEIIYKKGAVITDEENKTTTIESQTIVNIPDGLIKEIGIIVEDYRNKIIE
ncbi:MAG: hypothetical protein Kow0068_23460 [Marinilabiliales bacterium]